MHPRARSATRTRGDEDGDADETASLLSQGRGVSPARRGRAGRTSLPKVQLATVFAIKVLVPVALTQFLPYVNDMVDIILGTHDAGYYTGIVVCVFACALLMCYVYCGSRRAGDVRLYRSLSVHVSVGSSIRYVRIHHSSVNCHISYLSKDRIGRKPVIFIGISCISLCTLLLGVSRTLAAVVVIRFLGK